VCVSYVVIYKFITGRRKDRRTQEVLKWRARTDILTRAKNFINCFDASNRILTNQPNTGHTATRAAVAANVIKALQQKAAQLNID
jgi:hypothetical protein